MTDNLTIYKQIYPSQCNKIAELGYRSVLNIRPDAETETQPNSCDFVHATADANLTYHHLPFDDERLSLLTIEQFAEFYHSMPKPILHVLWYWRTCQAAVSKCINARPVIVGSR